MTEAEKRDIDMLLKRSKIRNYYEFHSHNGKSIFISSNVNVEAILPNGEAEGSIIIVSHDTSFKVKESPEQVIKIIEWHKNTIGLIMDAFCDAKEECAIADRNDHCPDCKEYYSCWMKRAIYVIPELEERV